MIPKIYDAPRTIRILGERDEEEIIKINAVIDLPKIKRELIIFHMENMTFLLKLDLVMKPDVKRLEIQC